MPPHPLLTLLSDFGWNDVYVGVMKGVIAQINPDLRVIDLTHDIPPQKITAAQFNLLNAYPYFPSGTIHVAVVDPGVGGTRRAIAVQLVDGILVGPDNGIFTGFLQHSHLQRVERIVELSNPQYWRVPDPSSTFHGRDIFAPAAAHLASGVPLLDLGNSIAADTLIQASIPPHTQTANGFSGIVQHIDRFGNVITTIPGELVQGKVWFAQVGRRSIPGYHTYSDAPSGQPLALIGSHGWVEIAINGGDAHFQLRLSWDDPVQVVVQSGT